MSPRYTALIVDIEKKDGAYLLNQTHLVYDGGTHSLPHELKNVKFSLGFVSMEAARTVGTFMRQKNLLLLSTVTVEDSKSLCFAYYFKPDEESSEFDTI